MAGTRTGRATILCRNAGCARARAAGQAAQTGHVNENADDEIEIGGDPACWAHLVCPECGRFAEGDSASEGVCAVCGAALPSNDD